MKQRLPIFIKTLVLLVLFGVGAAFANREVEKSVLPDTENATIEQEAQFVTEAERRLAQQRLAQPLLSSILEAVGVGRAEDLLLGVNDVPAPEVLGGMPSQEVPLQQTPEAQAIANYLVATSRLAGDPAPNRMASALSLANQGDKALLQEVAAGYRKLQQALAEGSSPEVLKTHNEATVHLLDRFAAFLEELAQIPSSQIAERWNGEERRAIEQEASRLTEELRGIVKQHNIVLPIGVIP